MEEVKCAASVTGATRQGPFRESLGEERERERGGREGRRGRVKQRNARRTWPPAPSDSLLYMLHQKTGLVMYPLIGHTHTDTHTSQKLLYLSPCLSFSSSLLNIIIFSIILEFFHKPHVPLGYLTHIQVSNVRTNHNVTFSDYLTYKLLGLFFFPCGYIPPHYLFHVKRVFFHNKFHSIG